MKPPAFASISDNLILKDLEINEAEYVAQKETVRYVCLYYLINNASANYRQWIISQRKLRS